jgi:tryptophan 2,3-dioxygenase
MKEYKSINIWQKFKQLPDGDQKNPELIKAMRHFDHTVNITWVMQHLNVAIYMSIVEGYWRVDRRKDWKKYIPKYQRRIFFPELWSAEELANWGVEI